MENPSAPPVPGRPRVVVLCPAAVFVCVVAVVACSSSPAPKPVSEPLPRSTVSASATTHVVRRYGYLAARQAWLKEGNVIDTANQGIPLQKAIADLEHSHVTGVRRRAEYRVAIAALRGLEKFPDAMDTRADDIRARAETIRIDKFFHLRAKRSCNAWPSTRKACWSLTGKNS
jgi:hypothetical protein